eukprot:15431578-Alexandrium_andersonii.AAC.1
MQEQLGIMIKVIDSVEREADNARQNEERTKGELIEMKRREAETRMAAESKARGKMWYPVLNDAAVAT